MPSQNKQYNQNKETIEKILEGTGVKINGDNPWDVRINNPEAYKRVLLQGSLGLGESYVDRWWDCSSLDQFFERILRANIKEKIKQNNLVYKLQLAFDCLKSKITNPQSLKKAFNIGEKHYNLGNDLFYYMLDNRMVYSCGYWKDAKNLNEAQEAKLELICKKIGLEKGMRVLDIGCGFGSFLKYSAENYLVNGIGATVSKEQKKLADERCKGLSVEIRFQDYRTIDDREKFDAIVSIGMFEHVGKKNYRNFMEKSHKLLKDDGIFLLHTIGKSKKGSVDKWSDKYIFTNGYAPTLTDMTKSFEKLFVMEDWHNFGADYDKTLMAWNENFQNNWNMLKNNGYDESFKRMWEYYLLYYAGAFRARSLQLWQIVLSKKGVPGGYKNVR